ncbi:MAG: T9SS type A sorting domain-containing protein [Bacteroidetes bacterium]|nr:T9SS type A sorting domain-containing protein [Bacteroidota bacterium]
MIFITKWKTCSKLFLLSFILLSFLTSNIFAQTAELQYKVESFNMSSGLHNGATNDGGETFIAFTGVIRGSEAPWLRVYFKDANLGKNSFIIMRSVWDGKEQKLDAISIEQWQYSSAYFNGFQVEIELHVAALDENIFFTVNELAIGEFIDDDDLYFTICGSTDDRVSSDQHATGRLLNIGCTAWIIPNGHFISAGHCIAGGSANVVQFQVPLSLPNGTLQHPGPEDQYSVNVSTKVFVNGGVGNDWGTFEVFPNSVTGLLPKVAQGAFWPLVQDLGPDSIRITGYGVDGPPPNHGNPPPRDSTNQTQQTHVGPNAGSSGTTMRYVTDTQGGNSGSPVIDALTGNAVGVHTHGGCNSSGGNNNGTSTFNSAFWIAVEQGAGNCSIAAASNPNPAHLTTDVSANIAELTWTNGADAISNELYFGADPDNLPLVQSGTLATSWNVTGGPLDYSTVYYWMVVEIGDTCSSIGPLWSFTTQDDPTIICVFTDEFTTNISKWTILGPSGLTNWSWQPTGFAGGGAGEMRFTFFPSFTGDSYVISDVIPSAGLGLTVEFTHYLDWAAVPFTIGFGYTTDGGTTWTELWSAVDPPGNIGPETLTFPSIPGDTNFQLGAWFSGFSSNLDSWLIDNVYACYVIPVEMISFAAIVSDGNVTLNWSTATELNNLGFEVQRSSKGNEFVTVGFVNGKGTVSEIQNYTFTDRKLEVGNYSYRLKQNDYDGTFEFSDIVEVEVLPPNVFSLEQNYPNPFNPVTKIKFSLAADSKVNLTVFDVLGQEVANLIRGNLAAGSHEIDFNASNINSGVYFYRIDATGVEGTNFTSVKKMILTK